MFNFLKKLFTNEIKEVANKSKIVPSQPSIDYTIRQIPQSEYIVLDVETTGLSYIDNEIIQIAILHCKNNEIIDKFVSYVKPSFDKLTPTITKLTGITQNDLKNAPSFKDIADKIYHLTKNKLIVAHNAKFDMGFICQAFKRIGYQKDVQLIAFDTLRCARKYIPNLDDYKLTTLKKFLKIIVRSHDALNDCLVTQKLYEHLYSILISDFSYDDFQISTHQRLINMVDDPHLFVFKRKTKGNYSAGTVEGIVKYHVIGKTYIGIYGDLSDELVRIISENDLAVKEAPASANEKYRIMLKVEEFYLLDEYVAKCINQAEFYVSQSEIDEADLRAELVKNYI